MSFGKKLRSNQTIEYKKGKISKHFAKYSNIRATLWQTIKQRSIIPMRIGIKRLWDTKGLISDGKLE